MNNLQMEKERVKREELVSKINAMSSEDRRKFMTRLAIQMRLDSAKMQDLQQEKIKLENIPNKKKMKEWQIPAWILPHAFGGFIAGAMVVSNMPELVEPYIDNVGVGMLSGTALGFLTGMLNGAMWEERPVSNAINGIRKYLNGKRVHKLEEKIELNQIVADGVVEMSAQGDYEDMEAYSNY